MEQNRKHISENRRPDVQASVHSQVPLGIPLEQGQTTPGPRPEALAHSREQGGHG